MLVQRHNHGPVVSKSPPEQEPDGPHLKPPGEQKRCAVVGHTLDGDTCTVVLIRDGHAGVVWYPYGASRMGVRIPPDGVATLRDCLGEWL